MLLTFEEASGKTGREHLKKIKSKTTVIKKQIGMQSLELFWPSSILAKNIPV